MTDINDIPLCNPLQTTDVSYRFTQLAENTTDSTRFYTYTAEDVDEDAVLRYSLLHDDVIGEDEMKRPVQDKTYLMVSCVIYLCYLVE